VRRLPHHRVMAGLVPAIRVLTAEKTWAPGARPGMTSGDT
jgi:hypothetical protein